MADATYETRDEAIARRDRLTRNAQAAEERGDKATAARMRETATRLNQQIARMDPAPARDVIVVDEPETGNVRLHNSAGLSATVHERTGRRHVKCRPARPVAPSTKIIPTDAAITCRLCSRDAEPREDIGPSGAPPVDHTRRTGGKPRPFRVDEPLPPLDAVSAATAPPEKGWTAGDLAALMLGAPIDASKPLRVIGTLTSSSVVGIMASPDGSIVIQAVD